MIIFTDAYNVTILGIVMATLILLSYALSVALLVRALKKNRDDWKIFTLCGLIVIFPFVVFAVLGLALFMP